MQSPVEQRTTDTVRTSYGARADEYIAALGDFDALSPIDRGAIHAWAADIDGRIVDAGCGPGHWTEDLRALGAEIEGIDMVEEFLASAQTRFPDAQFRGGTLEALPVDTGSLAGILSWYSVIHTEPERVPSILQEFARCLAPGGSLMLGFFEGPQVEPFAHAITTAYFWPVPAMSQLLEDAGFDVVSVHTRTDDGRRPHAAITAVKKIEVS